MSNIKPGDLVMVVKPTTCCGNKKSIGKTFKVKFIINHEVVYVCKYCGMSYMTNDFVSCGRISARGRQIAWNPVRLIKIDPPPISEDTTEDLKLHEPA